MKLSTVISLFLLLGLAVAAPAPKNSEKSKESKKSKENKESKESSKDDRITVTLNFYPESFVVYRSKHEIVNIVVPINSLNFDDDSEEDDTNNDSNVTLFFVEADFDKSGNRVDKGLYVLKGGKEKKLLDNGRDAAATSDDSKDVFFGAKDGIYKYDPNNNRAVKYGSVTDSIIGIAKENGTDVIYILTDGHNLFKVSNNGEKKVKMNDVVGAREIVLDNSNNLYYYGKDNKPYVVTADGVKKIQGLPEHPTSVKLISPPFVLENGVPFLTDNVAYFIYANGTSAQAGFDFKPEAKPSAYGMDAALIQYYAHDKKIYEYNVLALVLSGLSEELKNYFDDKVSTIESMATRSRSGLRPR